MLGATAHRSRLAAWCAPLAVFALVSLGGAAASAAPKHKKQLRKGEKLFYEGKYEEVLFALEELAANADAPDAVRVSALKFVSFSYFLLGAKEQAAGAWKRLLEIDPNFRLDPVNETPEFVQYFNAIGDEPMPDSVEPSGSEEIEGTETSEGTEGNTETAGTETIEASDGSTETSAATQEPPPEVTAEESDERGCGVVLCLLPGGVGQFANGSIIKGVVFAVLEATFLALNITFWAMNESLEKTPDGGFRDLAAANQNYTLQMTFFGLTVGSTLVGIIDAFVFP